MYFQPLNIYLTNFDKKADLKWLYGRVKYHGILVQIVMAVLTKKNTICDLRENTEYFFYI